VIRYPQSTVPTLVILLFLLAGSLGFPCSAAADIFRYQDDKGVVYFTNVPSDPKYRLFYRELQNSPATSKPRGLGKPAFLKSGEANLSAPLTAHIEEASQIYGLDPKLVQAVIHVESRFDPKALSPKGAQGLMQLMPQTARDLQVGDPYNPRENIEGGARYLRYLLDIYNQDLSLALAAYNAGPEKVNLYKGIPPYLETRSYVQKVIQIYNRLKSQLLSSR
jgi:soluble lytic murein transglycosylase-like protein